MIWFHRHAPESTATDQRLSDLDDRLDAAEEKVKENRPRAARAKARAQHAAHRRAKAIAANHFDQLFMRDLQGGPSR